MSTLPDSVSPIYKCWKFKVLRILQIRECILNLIRSEISRNSLKS